MQIIDSTNHSEFVSKSGILYFTADWCGPCKMMRPVLDQISANVGIGMVNVDANSEIAQSYGIRNIPTLLFIKNGHVVDKHIGAAPYNFIMEKVKKNGI